MNDNLIELSVDFKYENGSRNVLSGIKGNIAEGRCVCFCGESGCGKSTLLRCIDHLVPEFYEGELTGAVCIGGEDISEMSVGEVSRKVSSVFQDPRSQFFTVNSTTEVAFGVENSGLSHEEIVRRTDEAFKRYGLEKLRDRPVFRLSSGERQLIAILSAVAMDTDIILLDEPTANLDTAAIDRVAKLLKEIKAEGKTIIINEHRLYFLKDIADEYWYIKDGVIKEKYTAEDFTRLSAEQLDELGLRNTDLDCVVREDNNINVSDGRRCTFEVKGLCYGYDRENAILSDVSYKCATGSITGIIGSNGSGKTTFGKCISGLLKAEKGEYLLNGSSVRQNDLTEKAMFIMQEAEFQFFSNTVMNEIKGTGRADKDFDTRAEQLLKRMNLWECRNRHPFSLSGGQMQKLTLILAYFSEKQIIVLDEPTAGMDSRSLKACAELIKEMAETKTVFIITHDTELISKVCTDVIAIRKGKLGQHFVLDNDSEYTRMTEYMKQNFSVADNVRKVSPKAEKRFTDMRVYLLYLAAAVALCFIGNTLVQAAIMTGLLVIAVINKQFRQILIYVPVFCILAAVPFITKQVMPNVISNFFLRCIPVGFASDMLFSGDGASKLIASLRKMHTPEKVIMICSVIFRFFPVIGNDMKISAQSVRTRGFFPKLSDKLKNLPLYTEILIVPMMFRVIRIAEFLSASAETRGISLECRKHSYIDCRITLCDCLLILLLPVLIAVYQILLF